MSAPRRPRRRRRGAGRLLPAFLLAASCARAADVGTSIVGGQRVTDLSSPEFRHTARLLVAMEFPSRPEVPAELRGRTFSARCSAALLSERAALTAAHCLPREIFLASPEPAWVPVEVRSVRAYFRRNAREDSPSGAAVRDFVRHPGFSDRWYQRTPDAWNPPDPVNDLAVVFLEEPAPSFKAPAAAAGPGASLRPGQSLVLAGFGRADPDGGGVDVPEMRRVEVPYRAPLRNGSDFYAGSGDPAAPGRVAEPRGGCFGDSGGPAYLPAAAGWSVVGVIARGPDPENGGCGAALTVLTDVRAYAAWITGVLRRPAVPEASARVWQAAGPLRRVAASGW